MKCICLPVVSTQVKHNVCVCVQLARMRPEEYRQIIKNLETHFEEFKVSSHGSQMFADEDKRTIENQFTGAQAHYDQLVVQLPTYSQYYRKYTVLLRTDKNSLLSCFIALSMKLQL